MPSIQNPVSARSFLVTRDSDDDGNVLDYMIVILGLLFFALVLVSMLLLLKRRRRQQALNSESLPSYEAKGLRNHNNLTIHTTQNGRSSVLVINRDGQPMLSNPNSPPYSPDNVPEIHITFPDEHDEAGRTQSGRVLVVRVGDGGVVGLEPVREEQLPAYEKDTKTQFYSIDMNQIGGLKEKEYR
jgi:hypothetical protein